MTGNAAALPASGTLARWGERLSPKVLVSSLITAILVFGELQYQILGGYDRLALALGACIVTDQVASRLLWHARPRSLLSAYISGNSLAILLKPAAGLLWPFGLGAVIAILSKHALTWRSKHLWNPTNFAISVLVLLAPGSITILSHEWGNDLRVNGVIWAIGLLTVWRARILHVTLTYAAAFVACAGLRSAITGVPWLVEVAPITGPMYQLLVFFMLTDPPTSVSTRSGRMLVAVLIALVETVLRLGNDFGWSLAEPFAPAPAIFALFLVGPIAKVLDLERLRA